MALDASSAAAGALMLLAQADDELARWLRALDRPSAERLSGWGGRQRVLRSLEMPLLTGRTITQVRIHPGAERLAIDPERVRLLRLAAPMHDVGKIAITDQILRKPSSLNGHSKASSGSPCSRGTLTAYERKRQLTSRSRVLVLGIRWPLAASHTMSVLSSRLPSPRSSCSVDT